MSDEAQREVRRAVGRAALAGAIPVPGVDVLAIAWVQLDLVAKLARMRGARLRIGDARGVAFALAAAGLPKLAASAVKALPGVGWVGGAVVQSGLAAVTTRELGERVLAELDEDIAEREIQGDVARSLVRLERLRRRGAIDRDEYVRVRTELLTAL